VRPQCARSERCAPGARARRRPGHWHVRRLGEVWRSRLRQQTIELAVPSPFLLPPSFFFVFASTAWISTPPHRQRKTQRTRPRRRKT
jgi:hypothetical protein